MENTIILKAKGKLIDEEARTFLNLVDRRLQTINERTKQHTRDIKMAEKKIKQIEEKLK